MGPALYTEQMKIGNEFPRGLSIIIPLRNEEESIYQLCSELARAFAKADFSWELILVDDGSSDLTLDRLMSNNLPNKTVITYFPSRGQSYAIGEGILRAKYSYIGMIDGDGQNDPADLHRMFKLLEKNSKADFVQGNRYPIRNDHFIRKLLSRIANQIVRSLTGVKVRDLGCATKVFRQEVSNQIPFRGEIHRVYAAHAHIHGFNVIEAGVNHRMRIYGESKYGYSRIWKFILDVVFLRVQHKFSRRPIYTLGFSALIFLLISFVAGVSAISMRLIGIKNYLDGSMVSLSIIMFALAVILFFMAMITDEIMRNNK